MPTEATKYDTTQTMGGSAVTRQRGSETSPTATMSAPMRTVLLRSVDSGMRPWA